MKMLSDALQASQHVIVNVLRCYVQNVRQMNRRNLTEQHQHGCTEGKNI